MWGFLIHQKTWPPLLKMEHRGQTVGLTWGKGVQHDEIYLLSKFGKNLLIHVEVIALFGHFLLFFNVIILKNLLLRNCFTEFNESWYFCFKGYP